MGTKSLNVVIVGGSLGGLCAGIVLKRLGHTVKILERAPTALLHNQGAGIVAGGAVQEFFAKFDRTKTPISITSHERQYMDKEGKIINSKDQRQEMASWDLLYNILRANFDGAREEGYCSIPETQPGDGKVEYLYGHKVSDIKDLGDAKGVSVNFVDRDGKDGDLQADLLIAADGPSSTVRRHLLPSVERTYAGYLAWRGTVIESEVTENTLKDFKEKFAFFHAPGTQILAYLIPGSKGTLEPGSRLVNYVWYCNYESGSAEMKELMTDSDGEEHRFTLPAGKMKASVWEKQKKYANKTLPPQFAELVLKTKTPFIQGVTDVLPHKATFMDGKVLLVGDALAGFRPHTAGSTGQAAWHALLLGEVELFGKGSLSLASWEQQVMDWARERGQQGIAMGEKSQFGEHPLADRR